MESGSQEENFELALYSSSFLGRNYSHLEYEWSVPKTRLQFARKGLEHLGLHQL